MNAHTMLVEVGDEVASQSRPGRFVVLQVKGTSAEIRLFGETENGERVEFKHTEWVPLASLAVIK